MKLTPNDNAHVLCTRSNNNSEEGNNETISSNTNQRGDGRMPILDNHELTNKAIEDEMSHSTTTVVNCNSRILSNQQIKTVSSKILTRVNSAVDNRESWYTAVGVKETLRKNTNNSEDECVKNKNKNISSYMEQRGPDLFKTREASNIVSGTGNDVTQDGAEYTQPQGLLARENQDGARPTSRCTASKESTTMSDRTPREVDTVSSYVGSSSLGTTVEFQEGKAASSLDRKEFEQHAAQPMGSLNEREPLSANNTGIIKVTPEDSKPVPDFIKTLVEGKSVCGDTYVPFSKPDWLDMEKFQRGQRFGVNHSFGVMFADVISLMMLFSFQGGLGPLIFTGKSDTPFKAFRRYLSTGVRVKSWYEGDIWDVNSVAHKNLKAVRGMHDSVRKNMETAPQEEVAKRVTLKNRVDSQPMWTDLKEEIHDDFRSSCPFSGSPIVSQIEVYVNQCDMAFTQFGFVGLILLFPKMFGIHYASDADFEGFAHFWRTIGYLLGTGDRFNVCNGDLKTVRQQCSDIVNHWVKPKLREVSDDWIHMSRCVYKGLSFYIPNINFECMLMYLCRVLDIKAAKLAASLSFRQYFMYLTIVFLYWFVFRLPGMYKLFNRLIDNALKYALNMSPEHLMKLKHRVYPYETPSNTTFKRL